MNRTYLLLISVCIGIASWANAQPSASELADRILDKQSEQLRRIERVTITSSMDAGPVQGMTMTARYRRVERDGRYMLESVGDSDIEVFSVSAVEELSEAVRAASSVREDQLDGDAVYVVTIDDPEALRALGEMSGETDEFDTSYPKEAVLWLDRRDLIPYRMTMRQDEDGAEIQIEVRMDDYQIHQGLPVAHQTRLKISGMQQMIGEGELEKALREMRQLQQQLDQMPPEQRAMIEQMIAPQIAQLEELASTGETTMVVRVTDVSVE